MTLVHFDLSKSLKKLGGALRSSSESKSSLVVNKTHATGEMFLKTNIRSEMFNVVDKKKRLGELNVHTW